MKEVSCCPLSQPVCTSYGGPAPPPLTLPREAPCFSGIPMPPPKLAWLWCTIPQLLAYHSPVPSDYFHTGNPSLLPGTDLWILSLSTQPLPKCLSLWCLGLWYCWSAQLSLCFALLSPAVDLSSETLRLPLHFGWSPCQLCGLLRCWFFPLSKLPLRNAGLILIPFFPLFSFSFPFVLPNYVEGFLPLLEVWGLLPVFSRCSVWIFLHVVGVFFFFFFFFWCVCQRRTSATSYSFPVLILSLKKWLFWKDQHN